MKMAIWLQWSGWPINLWLQEAHINYGETMGYITNNIWYQHVSEQRLYDQTLLPLIREILIHQWIFGYPISRRTQKKKIYKIYCQYWTWTFIHQMQLQQEAYRKEKPIMCLVGRWLQQTHCSKSQKKFQQTHCSKSQKKTKHKFMRPCLGLFFDRMIMLAVVCSAMSSLAMFFWGNFLTCLHWGNSTWCITPCLKFRNLRYQKPHLSSDQNPSWVVTLEGWSTWFVGVCYHPQWNPVRNQPAEKGMTWRFWRVSTPVFVYLGRWWVQSWGDCKGVVSWEKIMWNTF